MNLGLSLTVLACITLTACGHHRDVRPGADNQHRVSVKATSPEDGARDALAQAQHFCKESEKSAFIIKEQSKYSGDIDESTYKNLKTASSVTKAFSQSTEQARDYRPHQNKNRPLSTASDSIDAYAGAPYETQMLFKCE